MAWAQQKPCLGTFSNKLMGRAGLKQVSLMRKCKSDLFTSNVLTLLDCRYELRTNIQLIKFHILSVHATASNFVIKEDRKSKQACLYD